MSKKKFTCFREKPKHRVRTTIIACLIVVALVAATVFGIGFFKKTDFEELEDKGYETVKTQVPADSSTPIDHTALEIVGYMNYTLSNQSNWYSEMHGQVNTIISQEIATYKQFSNGILISADITTSSMIANANQFCTTAEAVLWRAAAGGKETYNGKDTSWVSDAPQGMKIDEYKSKRGLPPSTFSVYIINEKTLLSDGTSERAVQNDDGTFSITLNLNTASDGETSAVYYYKQQMAVTGGLSSHPTFSSINVKYTFDSNYRVLKTEINETYQATMGVSVTCNAISTTEYNYESGWENTAYDDYFKNYIDNFSTPDDETEVQITAVGCLSSAFGSVLVDGGTFSIDLGLNGETESGIVDVALSGGGLSSLTAQIGNIDVRLENDGKNNLYVAYGSGAKFSLCIDDIDLSPLSSLMGGISIDTEALMEQLGNGTFTVSDDNTKATLECELSLLGLNIPLTFSFNILENGDATLNFVKTTLDLGGESISASLAFADRNLAPKPLTENEKAAYAAFDTAKINSLISSLASDVIKLDFDLNIGGIGIGGNVSIDIAKLALSADLSITIDGTTKNISIAYKDDMIYLTLGENSKIKTSLSQAIELISAFLSGSSTPSTDTVAARMSITARNSTSNASFAKTAIANGLKNAATAVDGQVNSGSSFSLMNLVYTLLFDQTFTENLSVSDNGEIKINVDGILKGVGVDLSEMLGTNVELGEFTAKINDDGNLNLSSPSMNVTVSEGEHFEIVEDDFVNVDLLALSDQIFAIINEGRLSLSGEITISIGETSIPLTINCLSLEFADGLSIYLNASISLNGTSHRLIVSYSETGAAVVFDNFGVTLSAEEYVALADVVGELVSIVDGIEVDINLSSFENIINTIISQVGSSDISVASILNILENLNISTDSDGNFILNLDGLGKISLSTADGLKLGIDMQINGISIAANAQFIDFEEGVLPTDLEYLDGSVAIGVLDKVSAILENKSVGLSGSISVTIGGTTIPVEISALNVDFSNGIEVELSATIELNGTVHSLYLNYNASGAKLVFDQLGVNLTTAELNELIAKIGELAGVSFDISSVGGLNVELNGILDIINNLTIISSESGLTVGYGEYEIVLGLGDKITASTEITIENIGISASLTLGEVAAITAPETECISGATLINVLDKVATILNNKSVGLSGSISITIGGTTIPVEISALNVDFSNGIEVELSATIELNGTVHSLYLNYNASGAKLVFDQLGVNLTTAELNELIAKIGELAGVSFDMSSIGGLNVELNGILDIINNLTIISSESGLTVGYGEYEIVLGLGGEITASTEITIENIGISASLTLGEVAAITAPETECISGATLINVLDKVATILNNKSVGLSGSISVTIGGTTIPVEISALNVDFSNGIEVELSATIELNGTVHSLYLNYNASGAKLVFDQLGVNLTTAELNELIAKIGELAGVSFDISSVGGLNVELNGILDIINNLTIISSESGLTVGYGEYEIVLGLGDKITASTEITIENIGISASLTLGEVAAITAPETECISGATLNALLEEISAILTDGRIRIAVTGENALRIIAGDTVVTLSDIIFELNFKNGIGFELNASIDIGNNKHDFYAFYADDMLKFSYGTFGAELKIGGADNDLDKLKSAVVELYNRVAKIIDTMTGAGTPTAQATSFDDLVALLKGLDSGNVLAGVIEQITSLVSIDTQTNTLDTIINLLNSLELNSNANGLTVKTDSLTVTLDYLVSENANFNVGIVYETNEFKIVAENVELGKVTENNGAFERVETYLTVDGFIEMLDYVGATVDMFAEDNFTLRLQGSVYSSEFKYSQYNSVRYNISAMLEFGWGENGYPAHLEVPDKDGNGTWNFWLDPTMYAHIGVNVAATHEDDESYNIDVYLLDSNPSTSNGITQNGASTDGELDIYISISVLSKGVSSNPLMIYMPVGDLMTIVAAGAAMLDLGSLGLNTDGLDGLNLTIANLANSVIGSLASAVDTLIIDKYLSDTREQFESLGASLITQILGSSLNDMISDLFSTIGGDTQKKQEVVLNRVLPSNVTAGGFIKELSFNENRDALVILNGEYIYGSADFDDIIFTATKHTVEKEDGTTHTLLRTAEIKNIYYNSNNKFSVDLGLSMSYDDIVRKTSFANYYNFAEIDSLLTTLVNSATHVVTKEDGTTGYDLNKNFYLDGSINLSVLGLYNASVAINGLSVSIDENNAVSANVRLSYDKVELFFGAVSVINNKAVVDISIMDDMIYLKRAVSGGATTYRAMTLSDFSGDIMNQMIYILSLGKTVTSNMNSSSSGGGSGAALDLGATIKQYLKSFTSSTNGNSKSWTLTINGSGIESLASGLSISDIPVTISAEKSGNGYVATSLSASGKMFSVISFNLGLTYRNPQTTSDSYSGDVTSSVYSETLTTVNGEAVSFEKILGGTSFTDISKTVEWKLLLADQGTSYFEYTGGDIKIGTLTYKYQTPTGQEMSFDGTYLALYNTRTNKLYTVANYPDLSVMEEVEGQTKVWAAPEISASGVVLRAVYANTYSVTVNSGYQTDYTPVEPELDGTYTTVYENVYLNQLLPINITVEDKDHNVYLLTGYTYADGTAVEYASTAYDKFGNLCIVLNVDGDKVVNAVWELARKVTLEEYSQTTVLYFVDGTQLTAEMLPETAQRVGYFGSWIFDGITLSEDIVITAEYVVSTHTISVTSDFAIEGYSLNSETGKFEWSQTFEYGTEYVFADIQSIDLYTFDGYYLTGGGKIDNEQYITSDMSLYIRWVAKTISVNVNSTLAYSYDAREYLSGDTTITLSDGVYDLSAPTAEGYTFLGWGTKNDSWSIFGETNLASYVASGTESLELYPIWAKADSSNISMSRTKSWFTYYFTVTGVITWTVETNSELLSNISCEATYSFRSYYDAFGRNEVWKTNEALTLNYEQNGTVLTVKNTALNYKSGGTAVLIDSDVTSSFKVKCGDAYSNEITTSNHADFAVL